MNKSIIDLKLGLCMFFHYLNIHEKNWLKKVESNFYVIQREISENNFVILNIDTVLIT